MNPASVLEEAADVVGDLDRPALAADQFLHPLPGRVVQVVCVHRGLGARPEPCQDPVVIMFQQLEQVAADEAGGARDEDRGHQPRLPYCASM